jgi:hypothetical protein
VQDFTLEGTKVFPSGVLTWVIDVEYSEKKLVNSQAKNMITQLVIRRMFEHTNPISPDDEGTIRLITNSEGTIPSIRCWHPVLRLVLFVIVVTF